jgi:hypothetical protein
MDFKLTHYLLFPNIHKIYGTLGGWEGAVSPCFLPFFSDVADVCEWYDDDAGCFRIRVHVENKRWGPLFGYTGSFQVEWRDIGNGGVPAGILPRRLERRE